MGRKGRSKMFNTVLNTIPAVTLQTLTNSNTEMGGRRRVTADVTLKNSMERLLLSHLTPFTEVQQSREQLGNR